MIKSKAWDWSKNESDYWLKPCMESFYLVEMWKSKGFKKFLDLGCGLGRHSVLFAQNGYEVKAVDLSEYAVNNLNNWAEREQLSIKTEVCDMLNLPFEDETFDCLMAYNVIYHTDTQGFIKSLEEIKRVLKRNGEVFITLISKNTYSYQRAEQYKRIDSNTILRDENDTEKNVPHFYADIEDIKTYFSEFEFVIPTLEQTEYNMKNSDCYSKHFNLFLRKK
jgi:ubiquinone/menaquinone biosynthesis C-methylase UbiE